MKDPAHKQFDAELKAQNRRASRHERSHGTLRFGTSDPRIILESFRLNGMRREEIAARHGEGLQLVKNGHWQVPPSRRPQGWERLGISE